MRAPCVANKYNLTPKSVSQLKVNPQKLKEPYFWRNNQIGAWCISGNTAKSSSDHEFGTYNAFWLGVYDKNSPSEPDNIQLKFFVYGDICQYIFDSFYNFFQIEHEIDLEIQEMFLAKINELIDKGVFSIK